MVMLFRHLDRLIYTRASFSREVIKKVTRVYAHKLRNTVRLKSNRFENNLPPHIFCLEILFFSLQRITRTFRKYKHITIPIFIDIIPTVVIIASSTRISFSRADYQRGVAGTSNVINERYRCRVGARQVLKGF